MRKLPALDAVALALVFSLTLSGLRFVAFSAHNRGTALQIAADRMARHVGNSLGLVFVCVYVKNYAPNAKVGEGERF